MRATPIALLLAACGSSTQATTSSDAPTGALHGAVGQWEWHAIDGTTCANGTPTGLGVDEGSGSEVVIFLAAGSTCVDAACTGASASAKKDGGFGAAELAQCVSPAGCGLSGFPGTSIFDRASPLNPYPDATYVFISNCTGDYYAGDADHAFPDWTAHFRGSANQAAFAAAVAESYATASRVVVTGSSAGAAGALLNYWQWVRAFPSTRVDLIADSFAFVFTDGPQWMYALHGPVVPPGCDTCTSDYRSLYQYNAAIAPPGARLAVLDSASDSTLSLVSGGKYMQGLRDLEPLLAATANVRDYIAEGSLHMLMSVPLDSDKSDIPAAQLHLGDFLRAMHDDTAPWTSASVFATP